MQNDDPEFVERAGEKMVRMAFRKLGLIPLSEYTQEDFDQDARAAIWRAEPDDFDSDMHPEEDSDE